MAKTYVEYSHVFKVILHILWNFILRGIITHNIHSDFDIVYGDLVKLFIRINSSALIIFIVILTAIIQ